MAGMKWVKDAERDATMLMVDGVLSPCPCSRCACIRKLATAVRLAGKEAQEAHDALGGFGPDAAHVILSSLLARLRSGDVEEK